ncbi:MAG: serine/threonine protein kinase [Bryobacterales bacterium]|nr:serine/threonine protein kinase [Bryobacterales bacterium]
MPDSGFERLEELFHGAAALPAAERAAFLREHCGGDEALRQELEEMLRADAEMLDVPVLAQIGGEDLAGQMAGKWRIGKKIGEGGLGIVYEAFAEERRAAIKFLRPGMDAGSFRRRFVKERRILQSLEHPHIARLLDGGVDETGRPYLVMEYVDGQPLDHYLLETKPGGTARLTLLGQVCEAVQYLHQALVAHGDLKPSNILAGADGQVKLVDFGAARLLQAGDTEGETTLTRAFLTPHYASPEQRQGDGPSVGSDIFALGVILGEAFPGADRDMTAIRDLCCRAEAEERYRSVLELGQDLERYGAKKPVLARRQDRLYRAGKFLRRNVAWVGVGAAVVAGLGTWGVFAWREMRAERERMGQMRAVVRSVLENASGQVVNGSEERRAMRDSMERAIGELEGAGTPGMELELAAAWRRLGAARLEEGDTSGGLAALERAYELAEREWVGGRDARAFESKAITLPLWALALHSRRTGAEAIDLGRRAVAMHVEYKQVFGRALAPQNPYWRMLLHQGPAVAREGQKQEGRALLEEVLEVARHAGSGEYVGRALVALAGVEPGRARAYCEEARRVAPLTPELDERCGAAGGSAEIAALREQIRVKQEELRHDPDRFQAVRRMARMHVQLGKRLRDPGEARREWEQARGYLEELVKRDAGNVAVREQLERVRELLGK